MFKALYSKELRERKWSLIAYCGISTAFLLMYIALFPSIQKEAANYTKLFESMPKAISDVFSVSTQSFMHVESFLSMELFTITWPILLVLLAISRAGGSISGEIERGSMGLLLSLPVSRMKLLGAKFAAGITSIVIFSAVTILLAIPLATLLNVHTEVNRFLLMFVDGILFGLAVYAVFFLLATLFSERSKLYFLGGGLVLGMYTLNIVSALRPGLQSLRYASLFYYFDAAKPLIQGTLPLTSVATFIVISFAATGLAFAVFNRRDIAV